MALVVNERLLRRVFQYPSEPPGAYADATARHGTWARTPALVVLATALGYERGREFRSLQWVYAEALVRAEPTRDWPECVHVGMTVVFAGAELTAPNHFYLPGERTAGLEHFWGPEEILSPHADPSAQWLTDERGYSCYLLSFMVASATSEERSALKRMLGSVGRGTALGVATASELHQTAAEFTAHYREFCRSLRVSPEFHQISADWPEPIPSMPEPVQLSSEQVRSLMLKLCSKLQNCRK